MRWSSCSLRVRHPLHYFIGQYILSIFYSPLFYCVLTHVWWSPKSTLTATPASLLHFVCIFRIFATDQVRIHGSRLRIVNVTSEHNGVYSCNVRNGAGDITSDDDFLLNVRGELFTFVSFTLYQWLYIKIVWYAKFKLLHALNSLIILMASQVIMALDIFMSCHRSTAFSSAVSDPFKVLT